MADQPAKCRRCPGPPLPGRKLCERCRAYQLAAAKKSLAKVGRPPRPPGTCRGCGAETPTGQKWCDTHRPAGRVKAGDGLSWGERRKQRRAAGLCVECGKPAGGPSRCPECAAKHNAAAAARRPSTEAGPRRKPAADLSGKEAGNLRLVRRVGHRKISPASTGRVWFYEAECLVCGSTRDSPVPGGQHVALVRQAARKGKRGGYGCTNPDCRAVTARSGKAKRLAGRRAAIVAAAALTGRTLAELAAEYRISRERVRQVLANGLSAGQVDRLLTALDPAVVVAGLRLLPAHRRLRVLLAALTTAATEPEGATPASPRTAE